MEVGRTRPTSFDLYGRHTNTKYTWEHEAATEPTPEQVLMRAKPLPRPVSAISPCPPLAPFNRLGVVTGRARQQLRRTRPGGDFRWSVAQRLH